MMQITREEALKVLVSALMVNPEEKKPEQDKPVTYPIMISIAEAAKRTGLSYDAIRKLCINNKIAHFRAGKRWLVNWDKLVDFLNGQAIKISEEGV